MANFVQFLFSFILGTLVLIFEPAWQHLVHGLELVLVVVVATGMLVVVASSITAHFLMAGVLGSSNPSCPSGCFGRGQPLG